MPKTEEALQVVEKELVPPVEPVDPLVVMRKPFAPNQISKMCKSTKKDNQPGRCKDCGGWHKLPSIQLSYVGHAALTDRLLDADPAWKWEPLSYAPDGTPLLDSDGGMWIKLTVAGVTRLGYGDAQGKTGGDATKERIGDALRNAAMRFGAALELWHKGDLHVAAATNGEPEAEPATNGDFQEAVEWIENSSTPEELKSMFTQAYNKFPTDSARKTLIEAKDRRKKELL